MELAGWIVLSDDKVTREADATASPESFQEAIC